jgi:hypothetical protein
MIRPISLIRYNHVTKSVIKNGPKKKIPLMIIVDEDDRNQDNKIKNIIVKGKVDYKGKIMLKREKSKATKDSMKLMVTYINQHHTREIADRLAAHYVRDDKIKNLDKARIIKTNDDHAGSIAGMTQYFNTRGVPFEIITQNVKYPEGWLTTKNHNNKLEITTTSISVDVNPQNDVNWRYRVGYDLYVESGKGPCLCKIVGTNKNKPNGKSNKFYSFLNKIKENIKFLYNKLESMFNKLFSVVFRQTKNKKTPGPTKPKTSKLDETKLSFTPINLTAVAGVVNSVCFSSSVTAPRNASKEINESNNLIAKAQVSKMLAKTGAGGDKTILNKKMSTAQTSYIAGMTSYNVNDAINSANQAAAKSNRKRRITIMFLSSSATALSYLLSGYITIPIIIMSLALIFSLVANFEPEYIIALNLVLTGTNIFRLIANIIITVIELIVKPPSSTSEIRVLIYTIISILLW